MTKGKDMKKADVFCWGCKYKWFDRNRYQRCSQNSTALFYFRCSEHQDEPLVSANLNLPKIERQQGGRR